MLAYGMNIHPIRMTELNLV